MEPVDVLAIGAHIGDCEIACGIALAAHVRQGKRVAMLHLTAGEKGHPTLPPDVYAAQKKSEAEEAASVLGAQLYVLDYRDGELPADDGVKFRVCDIIRACKPRCLVTHWHKSLHKDHANAAAGVADAAFYAAIRGFERSEPPHWAGPIYFAENWEDQEDFVPEVFLEVTEEDIEVWERAVRKHALFRDDIAHFPYVDYYRSLARVRGCEIGTEYAVAYAVPPRSRRRRVKALVS